MSVKLLSEYHFEFLSIKGGCTGPSESTLAKCHIVGNHVSRLNSILSDSPLCVMFVHKLYKGFQIGSVRIQHCYTEDTPKLHDLGS